jgi:translation initiation factor IF-1
VATVVEERPSALYLLVLENQRQVLAHLVGAVERNFVRLVPGDRVEVELAPQRSGAWQDNQETGGVGRCAARQSRIDRREARDEGTSVGEKDLRQMQGDPSRRRGAGHLRQPQT